MSPSDELPLFSGVPSGKIEMSIPPWRPTPADGWRRKPPTARAVETHGPDLLCRGLEFIEAAKRVDGARGGEHLRRFEGGMDDLAGHLVEWPDVEAGDDETADAARLVAALMDELGTLRRRILRGLEAGPRDRVLAAERRASSEPRLVQRIRALAGFLMSEARGEVVELQLSPSFMSMGSNPEPSSDSGSPAT